MQPVPSAGAPRQHTSRLARAAAVVAAILALTGLLPPPSVVLGDHGGREVGSLLACDRPVEPPRCTSVGNDWLHYVAFDPSLSEGLASSLRDTMAEDYDAPTRLHMIEQSEVTEATDVIAFSGDFGANGAAGWVFCPRDAAQGINARGDRWCLQQEMYFNLNPRYSIFFDDDGSRDHVACHELGHTIGLRHWGNPPETEGEFGATCMNSNTPNGPTALHEYDLDHIDAYPYRRVPTPPGVELVREPSGERLLAGGSVQATGTADPRSLVELVATSDAVVRGRVVSVEPGRSFGPASRPLLYASVVLDVSEVVAGALPRAHRETLVLELPMFDGAAAIDRLRDEAVGTDRLLFVRNKGETAWAAGMDADAVAADAGFYGLTAFGAELTLHDDRAWAADGVVAPLLELHGTTIASVEAAVARVAR